MKTSNKKERSTIMNQKRFKPGEEVPTSGQAEILNKSGDPTGVERTVVKGKPFPPTPKAGQKYVITDPTKHRK